MNQNTIREGFQQNGYVISRGFFVEEEMNTLIEDIKSAKPKNGLSGSKKGILTFYHNFFFHVKKIQTLISQSSVVDLLREVFGSNFWVRWDQLVEKGTGSGVFPWHQDNGYSELKGCSLSTVDCPD